MINLSKKNVAIAMIVVGITCTSFLSAAERAPKRRKTAHHDESTSNPEVDKALDMTIALTLQSLANKYLTNDFGNSNDRNNEQDKCEQEGLKDITTRTREALQKLSSEAFPALSKQVKERLPHIAMKAIGIMTQNYSTVVADFVKILDNAPTQSPEELIEFLDNVKSTFKTNIANNTAQCISDFEQTYSLSPGSLGAFKKQIINHLLPRITKQLNIFISMAQAVLEGLIDPEEDDDEDDETDSVPFNRAMINEFTKNFTNHPVVA